jgi:hypothetical protein
MSAMLSHLPFIHYLSLFSYGTTNLPTTTSREIAAREEHILMYMIDAMLQENGASKMVLHPTTTGYEYRDLFHHPAPEKDSSIDSRQRRKYAKLYRQGALNLDGESASPAKT